MEKSCGCYVEKKTSAVERSTGGTPMSIAFRAATFAAFIAICLPVQARDFRSADVHPADYPTVEAVKYMGKQLKRAEQGQHGVRVYPERRARQRAGHDRAAEARRARHDAHQRRAAEQRRPRDHRARACRSCSGRRSTCATSSTARSATRSSPRWKRRAWSGSRSTTAARARSTRRRSRSRRWPT